MSAPTYAELVESLRKLADAGRRRGMWPFPQPDGNALLEAEALLDRYDAAHQLNEEQ